MGAEPALAKSMEQQFCAHLRSGRIDMPGEVDFLCPEELRQLVPIDKVKTALAGSCKDESKCNSDLLNAADAKYLVTSELARVGDELSLTLVLFDAAGQRVVARSTEKTERAEKNEKARQAASEPDAASAQVAPPATESRPAAVAASAPVSRAELLAQRLGDLAERLAAEALFARAVSLESTVGPELSYELFRGFSNRFPLSLHAREALFRQGLARRLASAQKRAEAGALFDEVRKRVLAAGDGAAELHDLEREFELRRKELELAQDAKATLEQVKKRHADSGAAKEAGRELATLGKELLLLEMQLDLREAAQKQLVGLNETVPAAPKARPLYAEILEIVADFRRTCDAASRGILQPNAVKEAEAEFKRQKANLDATKKKAAVEKQSAARERQKAVAAVRKAASEARTKEAALKKAAEKASKPGQKLPAVEAMPAVPGVPEAVVEPSAPLPPIDSVMVGD